MDRWQGGGERAGSEPAHAHLVGIAGPGMSGLAQMLVQRGVTVTGSADAFGPAVDRLRKLGARVHAGHLSQSSPRAAQLLVYGAQVGRDHPERLIAARRGIEQASPAQWLAYRMRDHVSLAVAGGRDASVASAMIGWTLTRAGLDPTVVLGSAARQLGGWARPGRGRHFVVEAIGDNGDLGPLGPSLAVLLDVEGPRDAGAAAWAAAVRRFVTSVPPGGQVLASDRSEWVAEAVRDLPTPVEWISLVRGNAWWGTDLREDRGRFRFRAFHRGRFAVEVRLQVPGRRNVLSALAAVAACRRLDVPTPDIKNGLEEFDGLSRDFESRGSYRGVTLVDDGGEDRAAIAEVLAISREVFGRRRLWAVCWVGPAWLEQEPDRWAAALAVADRVLLVEDARAAASGAAINALLPALLAAGLDARQATGLDDAIWELDRHLEPGDVLVTLGAGDVGTIADAFLRRLSRDRQGR